MLKLIVTNSLTRGNQTGVVDCLHLVHIKIIHDIVQERVEVIEELDCLKHVHITEYSANCKAIYPV